MVPEVADVGSQVDAMEVEEVAVMLAVVDVEEVAEVEEEEDLMKDLQLK